MFLHDEPDIILRLIKELDLWKLKIEMQRFKIIVVKAFDGKEKLLKVEDFITYYSTHQNRYEYF